MGARNEYLLRAAELSAMAQLETNPGDKCNLKSLARAYLRLAEQAERNDQVYKTLTKKNRDQTHERAPRATGNKPDDQ